MCQNRISRLTYQFSVLSAKGFGFGAGGKIPGRDWTPPNSQVQNGFSTRAMWEASSKGILAIMALAALRAGLLLLCIRHL